MATSENTPNGGPEHNDAEHSDAEHSDAGHGDPERAAVAALTAAAHRTWTGPDGRRERYDFGEIACRVITTVAANLGGVEELLAGRPGSWEADHVRQIVYSTAGGDELALMRWRTEPIVLRLDPEDVFSDVGLDELYHREYATAEAALDALYASEVAGTVDGEQRERAEQLLVRVEDLYGQDLAAYHAAYQQTLRTVVAEHGITVPVLLSRTTVSDLVTEWVDEGWLAEWLHGLARARTPLPVTGLPPDWTPGATAAAITAAGRGYRDRAAQPQQPDFEDALRDDNGNGQEATRR